MVGQRPLKPSILVRVQARQQPRATETGQKAQQKARNFH